MKTKRTSEVVRNFENVDLVDLARRHVGHATNVLEATLVVADRNDVDGDTRYCCVVANALVPACQKKRQCETNSGAFERVY